MLRIDNENDDTITTEEFDNMTEEEFDLYVASKPLEVYYIKPEDNKLYKNEFLEEV